MFDKLANDEQIQKTAEALKSHGIDVVVVASGEEAKHIVMDMIPEGARVMTMTSITVDSIGLADAIHAESKHKASRHVVNNQEASDHEKKSAGHLSEWTVGSVHAVTEDGRVVIASSTGSQLPSYTYSSDHVVWVVGAQKIVKDLDTAMKRLDEYVIPLESVRARNAYGLPDSFHSAANKLLIFSREVKPGRVTMVIVKEKLGY